jgi:hypothetical protein
MDEAAKMGGKKDSNEGKGSDESKKDRENKLSDPTSSDERSSESLVIILVGTLLGHMLSF